MRQPGLAKSPANHPLDVGIALEQRHDIVEVRALLGHALIDTMQISTKIRWPQFKRAVAFFEASAARMLAT
jgi:site-specific recombinase XerC